MIFLCFYESYNIISKRSKDFVHLSHNSVTWVFVSILSNLVADLNVVSYLRNNYTKLELLLRRHIFIVNPENIRLGIIAKCTVRKTISLFLLRTLSYHMGSCAKRITYFIQLKFIESEHPISLHILSKF